MRHEDAEPVPRPAELSGACRRSANDHGGPRWRGSYRVGVGQALLVVAGDESRSLLSPYGPSQVVYLVNAVVAAALTWVFYYRYQLSVRRTGQKVMAFLCWASIWFTLCVVAALAFF